jgi:centromere/kinetochore protein ZW10
LARSRDTARSILKEAAAGRVLSSHVDDTAAKVTLLERELELSETLEGALDTLQSVVGLVDGTQSALDDENLSGALAKLLQAEKVLAGLRGDGRRVGDCRAVGLLEKRIGVVRGAIVNKLLGYWRNLVASKVAQKSITVSQQQENTPISLNAVVEFMSTLELLDTAITRLHRDIDSLIISPCVSRSQKTWHYQVESTSSEIRLTNRNGPGTTLEIIDDIYKIVNFISSAFPFSLSTQLLNNILPSLILQLVSGWLDSSLPLKLDTLALFKEIIAKVEELSHFVAKTEVAIPSEANLSNWLKKIPQMWLARRKETSLSEIRVLCYNAVKIKKTVERVETQVIQIGDKVYPRQEDSSNSQESAGDWDENWGNDEELRADRQQDDDDDTSAWDMEDSEPTKLETTENYGEDEEEGEAEAWGWGDEGNITTPQPTPSAPRSSVDPNRNAKMIQPTTKEVTLREKYTVTGIPDGILELINQIFDDARTLFSPDFAIPAIVPAAMGLASIPTLLLAMYRATASTYYAPDVAGQMLVYNDAVHLSGELKKLLSTVPTDHPLSRRLRSLDADISSLGQFSRRAYGREMDSQRTILSDILSSTSGFVNSTAPLNARRYAVDVQDAVNRVHDINHVWNGVLSDSVRLQSLGSLTGTLVKQIISDILERADDTVGISQEQSKTLKSFCDKVAELADLFEEPDSGDASREKQSLVHIYTPSWFRFKYLGEILDASLADIRYLWTEGELGLEFGADEAIDLIQALFADSTYRRDAIRDIRKPL